MDSIHTIITRCRSIVKYMFLFGCICNILLLSTTLYVMQVFDRVLSSGSMETLWTLTSLTLFALMLLAALQAGRIWMLSKVAEWLERQLEGRLFLFAIHNKDLITPFNTLKGYLTSQGFIALIDLPWSLLFVGVLFILHAYIGCLAVLGVIVVIAMAYLSYRYSRSLLGNYQYHTQRSTSYLRSSLENADTLRSMGDLHAVKEGWHEINKRVQDAQLSLAKRQIMLLEMGRFFRLSLQIAVTGIGAYLVLKNELSMGGIIVGSTLLGRVLAPIEVTVATWTSLLGAYRAYSLLKDTKDSDILPEGILPEEGDIRVDTVSFETGGIPILKDIDFTLERGKLLVLMGHNGAGKSTLIKIIAGVLRPTRGVAQRRGSLGYAPQSSTFFPGTIARTIARMSSSPQVDKVREAAKIAGADTWIENLPHGYDTLLDPTILSLGHRQQIILARAVYGNPTSLLLDEPDAFLDGNARGRLIEGLVYARDLKTTIIVVTHNPDIIQLADYVLIVRKGRMAAFGDRSILTQ